MAKASGISKKIRKMKVKVRLKAIKGMQKLEVKAAKMRGRARKKAVKKSAR